MERTPLSEAYGRAVQALEAAFAAEARGGYRAATNAALRVHDAALAALCEGLEK